MLLLGLSRRESLIQFWLVKQVVAEEASTQLSHLDEFVYPRPWATKTAQGFCVPGAPIEKPLVYIETATTYSDPDPAPKLSMLFELVRRFRIKTSC